MSFGIQAVESTELQRGSAAEISAQSREGQGVSRGPTGHQNRNLGPKRAHGFFTALAYQRRYLFGDRMRDFHFRESSDDLLR